MSRKQPVKIDFNLAHADLVKLPYHEQFETEVIGCCLTVSACFNVCYKYLKAPGIFYTPQAAEIWQRMKDLSDQKRDFSQDTMIRLYEADGNTAMAAWIRVSGLNVLSPQRLQERCLILIEYWIGRTIHRLGHHLNQNALSKSKDKLELLGEASDGISKIHQHIVSTKEKSTSDSVDDLMNEVVAISMSRQKGESAGLPSSLPELTGVLKGYRKGLLIIVAASTSEGKSTFAYQEVLELIIRNIPCGIISLEMKTSEVLLIMSCNLANLSVEHVLDGTLSTADMDLLGKKMSYIKTLPLYIQDSAGLRMGEVKAIGRIWKKQHDIQFLLIDHLHLQKEDIDQPSQESRFTNIANADKELAKELDIPIMACAQLSRKEKGNEKRAHIIEDIKYASGVEQAADIVLLLYRAEHHGIDTMPDGSPSKGHSRFIVAKARMLPKSPITAFFTGMRFLDWNDRDGAFQAAKQMQAPPPNPSAGITANYAAVQTSFQSQNNKWEDDEPLPF